MNMWSQQIVFFRQKLALRAAIGCALVMSASLAAADTLFGNGSFAVISYNDPVLGPVTSTAGGGLEFLPLPVDALIGNEQQAGFQDPVTGNFGNVQAFGGAQSGDRFVRTLTQAFLGGMTGNAEASGVSIWTSEGVPSTDVLANASFAIDRRLYFGDYLNESDRRAQLQSAFEATGTVPATQPLELRASFSLTANVTEIESGIMWQTRVQDSLQRRFSYFPSGPGDSFEGGDILSRSIDRQTNFNGTGTPGDLISFTDFFDRTDEIVFDDFSQGGPAQYLSDEFVVFSVSNLFLRNDRTYKITLSMTCDSSVGMAEGLLGDPFDQFAAECRAVESGYWLGLQDYRDKDGNPINPVRFISTDTGLDLALPSPSAPGGNTGIPEPTTWALLIAGFGLVGATLRRSRRARAAA